MSLGTNVLINLSGRGDKDLGEVALVERGGS
jgi:tryptophan synthase beta subunit